MCIQIKSIPVPFFNAISVPSSHKWTPWKPGKMTLSFSCHFRQLTLPFHRCIISSPSFSNVHVAFLIFFQPAKFFPIATRIPGVMKCSLKWVLWPCFMCMVALAVNWCNTYTFLVWGKLKMQARGRVKNGWISSVARELAGIEGLERVKKKDGGLETGSVE